MVRPQTTTTGPTSARVRFAVFTYESRGFVRPGEDPIVTLPSPDQQETEALKDAWLYLFTWRTAQQSPGKTSRSVRRHPKEVPVLAFELYADREGRYHAPERLDGPGQPHITLTLDDSTASLPAQAVHYGCWISPFRVPTQRLPMCTSGRRASDPDATWNWLRDRGVLSNGFLRSDLLGDPNRRGACYTAVVRSPVHRALQLADDAVLEGARNIGRFSRTQGHDAAQLRYLHASVTHLLENRPEMGFASRLDMNAFMATKHAIEQQDKQRGGVEAALQAVETYTNESEWHELLEDMAAAGPPAYERMVQPLGIINGLLGTSPKTLPTAVDFFEKHPQTIDPASYSDAFKSSRRGFKMVSALLKAAADIGLANDAAGMHVDAAGQLTWRPDGSYQRVQNAIAKWVRCAVGAEILKDHEAASIVGLKDIKRAIDLPSVLWIAVLVDSINAWRALRDTAKARPEDRVRPLFVFTSSLASLARSMASLMELRLSRVAVSTEIAYVLTDAIAWQKSGGEAGEALGQIIAWERMGRPGHVEPFSIVLKPAANPHTKPLAAAGAKAARVKLLRSILGAAGSAVDTGLSIANAWQEYRVDDFNAAFAAGVSALGSFLSLSGYLVSLWNPAIGIVLVAGGEVLMLVGTVAYAFCKNSDLESWLDHCLWGNSRSSQASGRTKWSRGSLSEYHGDLTKQIAALDELLFPLELTWGPAPARATRFDDDDLCYLEIRCPMLSPASSLTVGVSGEVNPGKWVVVRPLGPLAAPQAGAKASIVVRAGGYRRLVAHCKIDLYGDGQHVLPHDEFRSAAIRPKPVISYEPSMIL